MQEVRHSIVLATMNLVTRQGAGWRAAPDTWFPLLFCFRLRLGDVAVKARFADFSAIRLRGVKAVGRRASKGRPPARRFGLATRIALVLREFGWYKVL